MTRLDISINVNYVSQLMASPTEANFHAVKQILCYISGTLSHGLQLQAHGSLDLYAYSGADGLVVLLLIDQLLGFAPFWDLIIFLGVKRNNILLLSLALKLNTALWPSLRLNLHSLVLCYGILGLLWLGPLHCIVII
jgi:hypothetical protein